MKKKLTGSAQETQDQATPTEAPVSDPTPEAVQELSSGDKLDNAHATHVAAMATTERAHEEVATAQQALADARTRQETAARDEQNAERLKIDAFIDHAEALGIDVDDLIPRWQERNANQESQQDEPSS